MLLTYQNKNINNPERIQNIFNNYFSKLGEKTEAKIYFHQLTKNKLNSFSSL